MNTWNERLTYLVEKKGLKLGQVADGIGVSNGSMTGYMSGKTRDVSYDIFLKMANFLKVTPEWLAWGDGDEQPLTTTSTSAQIIERVLECDKTTLQSSILFTIFSTLQDKDKEFLIAYLKSNDVGKDMALILLQKSQTAQQNDIVQKTIDLANKFKIMAE